MASPGGGGGGVADDPMADFLQSVDRKQQSTETKEEDEGDTSLPPGVRQPSQQQQQAPQTLPAGWHAYTDPTTGHPFYVSPSGESTWRLPGAGS